MSFMQPEFYAEDCRQITNEVGESWIVPNSVCDSTDIRDYADYIESGKPTESEYLADGILWRLSAPGYCDCTEWYHANSIESAISDCLGMYGDTHDLEDWKIYADQLGDEFDEFWKGYLLALGFTSRKSFDDDSNLFGSFPGQDFADCVSVDEIQGALTDEQQQELLGDCVSFYVDHVATIRQLVECNELTLERCGSCFHFARNGHGVTFTDDCSSKTNEISYSQLRTLQDVSKVYGSVELVGDDIIN